jgi:hypothetical protein
VIADFILAGMAVEGVGLLVYRALKGRGPWPFAANLLAGASLLIAWRASESGAPPAEVGAALAAAGVAHGLDLAARWRASARESGAVPATIRWRAPRR